MLQNDHKKAIGTLERELKDELSKKTHNGKSPFTGGNYSFQRGLTHEDRRILTEDFTKLNRLTPAHKKPAWLLFIEEMTGFFALLLWGGSILCFVGFGLRGELDNVSCILRGCDSKHGA